ncbi:MAG: DNA mismatch repair endonuclease MutL [Candidatus Omnitrophica bacterium]|nr:DNA mismatch repair endonuclease MutL [Candidatus Omnitrophota bacterium]
MNRIQLLPPEIVSKIAAGEVVERPASVLKELLENSIDAKAGAIEVTLKDAGKTLIRVKDNGSGIPEQDIDNIFQRHATSKIQSIEDLYNINSLGFRGEALYSIGAISDVILRSRTDAQEHGWEIHLRANLKAAKKPATMQRGTDIEVRELFFNTPARKKFLKSDTSELNHLLDIFVPYTLLYPAIRFSLNHAAKKIIDLSPAQNLRARAAEALRLDIKNIIEEKHEFKEDELSVHLVLGDINIQRTRKDLQFIFINNRPVQNKTISFHLNDVYRLLFSPGVYPFFAAYFTIPVSNVDVNVHPTKREVKLKDESRIIPLLRRFTEQVLMTRSKARQAEKSVFITPGAKQDTPLAPSALAPSPHRQGALSLEENMLLFKTGEIFTEKKDDLKEKLLKSRYLGNLLRKYLLFEAPGSLLVVDQHAAQERIVFEKLKKQIEEGRLEIQELLTPVIFKLTAQEIMLWEENKASLEKMGFSTTLFDKETLAVHSHPQLIINPEAGVRNLLAGESIARMEPEKMARLACRSSVMAGQEMNKEQAEYQRRELLLCKAPFTCPHGRPTVVEIPEASLGKQFLR